MNGDTQKNKYFHFILDALSFGGQVCTCITIHVPFRWSLSTMMVTLPASVTPHVRMYSLWVNIIFTSQEKYGVGAATTTIFSGPPCCGHVVRTGLPVAWTAICSHTSTAAGTSVYPITLKNEIRKRVEKKKKDEHGRSNIKVAYFEGAGRTII